MLKMLFKVPLLREARYVAIESIDSPSMLSVCVRFRRIKPGSIGYGIRVLVNIWKPMEIDRLECLSLHRVLSARAEDPGASELGSQNASRDKDLYDYLPGQEFKIYKQIK
jgi:hypothetical protein